MCRKNQLYGFTLIAFGVGLMIGNWLESGIFCFLLGLGGVFLGLWMLGKK